jgi:ketosteroid isomerase-like protein
MTSLEVVRKMMDAFSSGDRAAYLATASPDIRQDEGQFSARSGEDAWAGDYDLLHEAFPDVCLEPKTIAEQGDLVAGEIMVTGTHTGQLRFPEGFPIGEIAPTGKSVSVLMGYVARVENGHIVMENTYGWLGPLLHQLSVSVKYEVGAPA